MTFDFFHAALAQHLTEDAILGMWERGRVFWESEPESDRTRAALVVTAQKTAAKFPEAAVSRPEAPAPTKTDDTLPKFPKGPHGRLVLGFYMNPETPTDGLTVASFSPTDERTAAVHVDNKLGAHLLAAVMQYLQTLIASGYVKPGVQQGMYILGVEDTPAAA